MRCDRPEKLAASTCSAVLPRLSHLLTQFTHEHLSCLGGSNGSSASREYHHDRPCCSSGRHDMSYGIAQVTPILGHDSP